MTARSAPPASPPPLPQLAGCYLWQWQQMVTDGYFKDSLRSVALMHIGAAGPTGGARVLPDSERASGDHDHDIATCFAKVA